MYPRSDGAGASRSAGTGVIFMYHHVSPTVLPGPYARALTLTPNEFREQLVWLRAHGCRVVSVDVLRADTRRGVAAPCEAALTFDDGYEDVATVALPLLREFGDVGTFYIATGYVGTPGHLSIGQLRALRAAGMEIGAHTVHHVDLTALPRAQASREIGASLRSLRRWLGISVTSFAYPAGQVNPVVVAIVHGDGVDNAVITRPGTVNGDTNRFALPRYRVSRGDGTTLLAIAFGQRARAAGEEGRRAPIAPAALANIARQRIAGNDPTVAEDVAVALLARGFPEQILKVHVLALRPAIVAGIVLSGVKFHRARSREQFEVDVSKIVQLAFAAAPTVNEVDVWATVPVSVSAGQPVSGDYAVPTSRTVFSAAVLRQQVLAGGRVDLGTMYWDPQFLR
ncbi:MAG: polysaccharide deacetylase family protein [Candidatus Eremiobacteraeota bacterium]|nr:polysaccharide deacetylase family protein [Candidatus Eremiobacteraeota bacterium]